MSQPKNFPSKIDDILERRESSWLRRGKEQGALEMRNRVVEAITRRIIHEQQHNSSGGEHMIQTLKAIRAEVDRL